MTQPVPPGGTVRDATPGGGPPLFRRAAVAALGQRWFGPVLVVTPPSALASLGLAGVVVAMLIVASVTIEIPDRVRSVGQLLPADGLLRIRASRAGRVGYLGVRNGDPVIRGQVLLRLVGAQRPPGGSPQIEAHIASLRREQELHSGRFRLELAAVELRIESGERRLGLAQARIDAAGAEAESRGRQAELYRNRSIRLARLAESGAVTGEAVDEADALALQAAAASQSAQARLLELQDEQLALGLQQTVAVASADVLRNEAAVAKEALAREIAASEQLLAHELVAPATGVVAGLNVHAGDDVAAGEVLMIVFDPDSRLEAQLYLKPSDVGLVRAGQQVELQLDAFPHQYFGTQTAVVADVAAAAVPGRDIAANLELRGPVFVVRATLADRVVFARGRAWPLPPGTVFKADLVRNRWPLYRWILLAATGGRPES